MKSAIILAILGAAAALPAPQGPPPGMDVPTGSESSEAASATDHMIDPTPTDGMADSTPSGISWGRPQPTGGADRPGHKTQTFDDGSWKSMSFDDGSWSKWASATGGRSHHPRPTGGQGSPTGGHWSPSGWQGKHFPRPTGHHQGGIPTPMPDDDDMMTTMVRRGLDIDYHLAPRRHGEDGQEKGDYDSWHKTQTFDDGSWGKWASKTGGGGGGHGPRPTGTGTTDGPDAPEVSLESHRNGRPHPSGGFPKADPSGSPEGPTPTVGGPMKPTPSDEDPSDPTPSPEDPSDPTPSPEDPSEPTPTASEDPSEPTPTASEDPSEPTPTPEEKR